MLKLYYSLLLLSLPALLQAAVIPPNPFNPPLVKRTVESDGIGGKANLNNLIKAMFWPKTDHDLFTFEESPNPDEKESESLIKSEKFESPLCSDLDCLGKNRVCTTKPKKDIPCWQTITETNVLPPTDQKLLKATPKSQ